MRRKEKPKTVSTTEIGMFRYNRYKIVGTVAMLHYSLPEAEMRKNEKTKRVDNQ